MLPVYVASARARCKPICQLDLGKLSTGRLAFGITTIRTECQYTSAMFVATSSEVYLNPSFQNLLSLTFTIEAAVVLDITGYVVVNINQTTGSNFQVFLNGSSVGKAVSVKAAPGTYTIPIVFSQILNPPNPNAPFTVSVVGKNDNDSYSSVVDRVLLANLK